jgi:hypothetical protein
MRLLLIKSQKSFFAGKPSETPRRSSRPARTEAIQEGVKKSSRDP